MVAWDRSTYYIVHSRRQKHFISILHGDCDLSPSDCLTVPGHNGMVIDVEHVCYILVQQEIAYMSVFETQHEQSRDAA